MKSPKSPFLNLRGLVDMFKLVNCISKPFPLKSLIIIQALAQFHLTGVFLRQSPYNNSVLLLK